MVGEGALLEPLLPVVGGAHQSLVGLRVGGGERVLGPAERGERGLPLMQDRACPGARTLEPEVHVGDQPQLEVHALRAGRRLVVAGARVGPFGGEAPVVEDRFAVEVDLGPSLYAAHGPQQHVVGVVVGGRAPMGARALLLVVPGPDAEHIADHHPPGARLPAGLEHQRAGQVAHRAGHGHPGRAQPKAAGVAVEHRPEHARRVQARQAHPLDVAARRDQRAGLAVRQEAVVGDRRKRAPRVAVRCRTHRAKATGPHPRGDRQPPSPRGAWAGPRDWGALGLGLEAGGVGGRGHGQAAG